METLIVSCINKTDRTSRHERIRSIGGIAGRQRWKRTQEKAIDEIQQGESEFFVEKEGTKVKVIVEKSEYGHLYLKTQADKTYRDNLLALPECP